MSKFLKKKEENLEDLGCAKIKGARNGSDARKLEGREKLNFGGARKLEARKLKARKFKGIRYPYYDLNSIHP